MTTPDVSKLSYAELLRLSKELEEQISAKRSEELKVLADGYVKKVQASGFSVMEAIDALQPYVTSRGNPKKGQSDSVPVLYRDTAHPENTWTGRGRPARWLSDYEAQGRSRDEFRV